MGRFAYCAIAFGFACGGGSSSGQDPDLDAAFTGTWTGPATLTLAGEMPQSYTARIVVAVSGRSLTAANVCLDGSGSIAASGGGRSASWTGSLSCPPASFSNCASVTETFQSATIFLEGNALFAQGGGTMAGCGVSKAFFISMTASKG